MAVLVVPYHQDKRLIDGCVPLPSTGDVRVLEPELPEGDIWQRLAALDDAVADEVAAALGEGGPVAVLSGDCLVAMGVLAGAQRAGLRPGVIWFDAHGDVHTLETTTSGYLGGLSLRLLLGAHPGLLAEPLGVEPVTEDRTVLVDARDLDPPEERYLRTSMIRRGHVADVAYASLPEGPLIVHVDVDVADPGELPGLLMPSLGGPSAAQVVAAVDRIRETGRIGVLSVACTWHPTGRDDVRRAREELLRGLLG
ncbi:arginase family protein [Actinomadura hibisca]|uniref:arginase family protein n=1 Tax=Actinomadura hibisca TaxID=68565 RepID=UPI00082E7B36|nr:arginase family protein [Actinomadura hibisca]